MNEHHWLTTTDTYDLLDHLYPSAGLHSIPDLPRKLRLYYVALARRAGLPPVGEGLLRIVEDLCDGSVLPVHVYTRLYELAELVANSGGKNAPALVAACEHELRALGYDWPTDKPSVPKKWRRPTATCRPLVLAYLPRVPAANQLTRYQHDADLLRDIFGNPFRPTPPKKAWLSEEVVGLARRCYDERRFNSLTVLADALEEAGCPPDHELVTHCRDVPTKNHARGCWVVDAILKLL